MRKNFAELTSQYAVLNEANRAWQEYHQTQLNDFRAKVQDHFQIDNEASYDDIAQLIVDQITAEREQFNKQYQSLENVNNNLQSGKIFLKYLRFIFFGLRV